MKTFLFLPVFVFLFFSAGYAQNVGIGTTHPKARLHVADSAVVFTGPDLVTTGPVATPVSGQGSRMMWLASKAAFRAGYAYADEWNGENIGIASFAAGFNTKASGYNSVAFHTGSVASGAESLAAGSQSTASGGFSIALGNGAAATGLNAVAIGHGTTAGAESVAIGRLSQTNASNSTALGHGVLAGSWGQTAVGTFNLSSLYFDQHNWVADDPAFVVGNGKSAAQRSTALTVLKNGNTGIGVMAPKTKLHVGGGLLLGNSGIDPEATLHVEGGMLSRYNSGTGTGQLILEETEGTDGSRMTFRNTNIANRFWELYGASHTTDITDAYFAFFYQGPGNVLKLYGNGNAWLKGSLSQNSDARLKKNIFPIGNAVQKLQQLSGYTYFWKDSLLDSRQQAGLLAQEVEAVFPEMVTTNSDGVKAVNYTALLPYLLQAVKEQQVQIDELKATLKDHQKQSAANN